MHAAGQQAQPAGEHRGAEAVAGRPGACDVGRGADEARRTGRSRSSIEATLVSSDRPAALVHHVDQRGRRSGVCDQPKAAEQDGGERPAARSSAGRAPAPREALRRAGSSSETRAAASSTDAEAGRPGRRCARAPRGRRQDADERRRSADGAGDPEQDVEVGVLARGTPASGRPSAPPTPSVALTSAIAEPDPLAAACTAASRLMPSGIAAAEQPWIARPTISTRELSVSASISEPTTSAPRRRSSMRRLPNMSAEPPTTGTATAPTSRVEVSSHWCSGAVRPARAGSAPAGRWSGRRSPRGRRRAWQRGDRARSSLVGGVRGRRGGAGDGGCGHGHAPRGCGRIKWHKLPDGTVCQMVARCTGPPLTWTTTRGVRAVEGRERSWPRAGPGGGRRLRALRRARFRRRHRGRGLRGGRHRPRTFFRYFRPRTTCWPTRRVMSARMRAALQDVPVDLPDAAALRTAVLALGEAVVADADRTARLLRVVRSSDAARPYRRPAPGRASASWPSCWPRSGRTPADWRTACWSPGRRRRSGSGWTTWSTGPWTTRCSTGRGARRALTVSSGGARPRVETVMEEWRRS